jgi:hypothetical protein
MDHLKIVLYGVIGIGVVIAVTAFLTAVLGIRWPEVTP